MANLLLSDHFKPTGFSIISADADGNLRRL